MGLDNFAIVCSTLDIAIGAGLTTACGDGSSRADIGIGGPFGGVVITGSGSNLNVDGVIRFEGESTILAGGIVTDAGVTENDPLAGIIEQVPGIVQGYLLMSDLAVSEIPPSPSPSTIPIYPGINICLSSFLANSCSFAFYGPTDADYIMIFTSDCVIFDSTFATFPTRLTVVVQGDLTINVLTPVTLSGTWLVLGQVILEGIISIGLGRIVGTGTTGVLIATGSVSITTAPFSLSGIVDGDSLTSVALANPALCQ